MIGLQSRPVVPAGGDHIRARSDSEKGPSCSPRRCLVVEDEPVLRRHMVRLLSRRGYEVDEAEDGRRAIKQLDDNDYDVVVTDLMLGVGSGLEVVQRASNCPVPPLIIVVTGYLSSEIGRQALLAGASDFLEKPFTRDRLLSTLPQA